MKIKSPIHYHPFLSGVKLALMFVIIPLWCDDLGSWYLLTLIAFYFFVIICLLLILIGKKDLIETGTNQPQLLDNGYIDLSTLHFIYVTTASRNYDPFFIGYNPYTPFFNPSFYQQQQQMYMMDLGHYGQPPHFF